MLFLPLLALCGVALADGSNSTSFSWSMKPGPRPTPGPGGPGGPGLMSPPPNGFPGQIGDFQFYGCAASSAGFPSFTLTGSSEDMSLELCAVSCPSRFFGIYSTDCFCGEEVDDSNTKRVPYNQCNVPCPGNDATFCGGIADRLLQSRRQSVPLSVLLSVYIRVADGEMTGGPGESGESGKPGGPITPAPRPTYTETIISTTTGTITSCAPDYPDCPLGPHTGVTTITSTYCPEPTPYYDWHKKVIICYGDYCAPQEPCHGEQCTRHRVVCQDDVCRPEECPNDQWNKLVVCNGEDCHYPQCQGDECHKKVVCFDGKCAHEKCYGDECKKKFQCQGEECRHEKCQGDECYKKTVCEGDKCAPQPPCRGPQCPQPAPPAPIPQPQPSCPGPGCFPSCKGPECPVPTGGAFPSNNHGVPPVVAGSVRILPAMSIGAIAALAFFL